MDSLPLRQGPASEVSFVVVSEHYTPRFLAKIDRRGPDECWNWTASKMAGGYGAFNWEGVTAKAHRLAWRHAFGDIPDGLNVCHHCDNRICCNPAHLFLGTHLDNARDRNSKSRQIKGVASPNAKLSDELVRLIRCEKVPHRVISAKYGISMALVSLVRTRKAWTHVA